MINLHNIFSRLKRLLPTREEVRRNRWIKWLGPQLDHPRLWHWSRRGVAIGVGLGVFFGLLVPIAQIPLSAAVAIVMRVNVPAAVASTLVTNPVTFAPIYYVAYRVGATVMNASEHNAEAEAARAAKLARKDISLWERITLMGKPLLVGLVILATLCGLLAYGIITATWKWWVWRKRRRRQA